MIFYKTDEEIELLRKSCMLVCKTLTHVATLLKPGVTGEMIDKEAETLIRDNGAIPGFKGYRGFPATLCISINDQVVHGIPTNEPFKSGDVVSIDCGTFMNDFYGDAAYTFAIGEVDDAVMHLLSITKASLYKGIDAARVGNRLGDIGFTIQQFCEKEHNYGVVRELVGHGVGRSLHEPPEVANYGKRGKGLKLKEGLVIAIEPMVNQGKKEVKTLADGWTITTKDGLPSAHFEHTIAVRSSGPDQLSDHAAIEAAIRKNAELKSVPDIEMAISVKQP